MKSRNTLDTNAKKAAIDVIGHLVADSIDLALLTKQAHWNLRGPRFIAIHEMLDGFRTDLDGHVDTMAERVVQLGGTALGTVQAVGEATRLPAYPTDINAEDDHLKALIDRYGAVASSVREGIDQVDEAGDANSADILTAYSRTLDKSLWFLESHFPRSA
ncbi:DNA starvation/stationary phase protection protein Dps [Neorhizobium alkalisoli]|uniref:Starvation-inducible DNA-binding protein n=1 Tax=Neorhizobium alkalisoli TaxID=528178 RepID=A0A561QBL0_9HYPH|nr:DNA starvation/stationary phase protection protein Dps [Neorhizobium alkalisoli]TWF47722.1 starvation-inducible DNA-binding protein [Neorhizobium alkalisoli]